MGKVKNILLILLGNCCIAFAVSTLILERQMISGGVTGLGIAINHYTQINISVIVGGINIILFLLALFILGKEFAMRTFVATFTFPFILEFFNQLTFIHGYCDDVLLASVLAGGLIGVGVGLMIRCDASSGGTDVIGVILNKKIGVPIVIVVNTCDFLILCLQASFTKPMIILYSLVCLFISSYVLNKTITMGAKMIQLMIISDHYQVIKKMILEEGDSGVTALYSEKGYSETESKTLLTIIPPVKLAKIKERIKEIDPLAFMVVATVEEVSGRGYSFDRNH